MTDATQDYFRGNEDEEEDRFENNAVGALREMSNMINNECTELISLRSLSHNLVSMRVSSKKQTPRISGQQNFRKKVAKKSNEKLNYLGLHQLILENQENYNTSLLSKVLKQRNQASQFIKKNAQAYHQAQERILEKKENYQDHQDSFTSRSKEIHSEQFITPRGQRPPSMLMNGISDNNEFDNKIMSQTIYQKLNSKPFGNHNKCSDLIESSPSFKVRLRSRAQRQGVCTSTSTVPSVTQYSQKCNNNNQNNCNNNNMEFIELQLKNTLKKEKQVQYLNSSLKSQPTPRSASKQANHGKEVLQSSIINNNLCDDLVNEQKNINILTKEKQELQVNEQKDEQQLLKDNGQQKSNIFIKKSMNILSQALQIQCSSLKGDENQIIFRTARTKNLDDSLQIFQNRSNSLSSRQAQTSPRNLPPSQCFISVDKEKQHFSSSKISQNENKSSFDNMSLENVMSNLIFSKSNEKRQRLKSLDISTFQKRMEAMKEKDRLEQLAQLSSRLNQQHSFEIKTSRYLSHRPKGHLMNQITYF